MEEKLLLTERQEKVYTIIFNRPERRNALSPLMLFQLAETLRELQEEGEVRCLVIRGAGDKTFSSGYDINVIPPDVSPEVSQALRAKKPFTEGA